MAISQPTSAGDYNVDIYSAGNVAVCVSKASNNYRESQIVNSPFGRKNLYKGFNPYSGSVIEHTQIHLNRGDLFVLCSDGVKASRGSEWRFPEYNGGSLGKYCQSLIHTGERIEHNIFDDRSVLGHRVR